MKIIISTSGDKSVGIPVDYVTINWETLDVLFQEEIINREELRKNLSDFWGDCLDGKMAVLFGDECPDCYKIMKNSVCSNKDCPSSQ